MSEAECENFFDYWIYILNNMETLDRIPFTDKNPVFEDLAGLATCANLSEDEQIAYERALKRLLDYEEVMRYARDEAREEGLTKGRAEGRAEGVQEEKLKIALNMKRNAVPVDTIMLCTGLTKEQVEAL